MARCSSRVFAFAILLAIAAASAFAWRAPAVRASSGDVVSLAMGSAVHLATAVMVDPEVAIRIRRGLG